MASMTRSESAIVRPFSQIESADHSLDGVRLQVGGEVYEPGAVVLAAETQEVAKFALRLPSPQDVREAVSRTIVPEVDCGLVVIASGKSHRVSFVALQQYLKPEAWPVELELQRSSADLVFNDQAGFSLTVAVVLLHDLTPAPLRPHMAGTWLAKREFSIGPEREETSFSPEELTDELRAHYHLPSGAVRYVQVGEWQDAETLSDQVHVYLDRDVLNLLLANPPTQRQFKCRSNWPLKPLRRWQSPFAES